MVSKSKSFNENHFSDKLITWYKKHQRDLPWRKTTDPYKIWLSEIILQQTRVNQGLPYYNKFTEQYPTVFALAEAPEEDVLRLWQGLGYYSRARNLHACAKTIVENFNGKFPENFEDLLKLKGVGKYTAAAIASFSFKKAVPVVDGNVYRVFSRIFNLNHNIADPKNFKIYFELGKEIIPTVEPDMFNQGIMELGATICSPTNPACLACPVQENCAALTLGLQKELPVKIKKTKVRKRFFQYLVWKDGERLAMNKRSGKDIWTGLFDFDLWETDAPKSEEEILEKISENTPGATLLEASKNYKHILSHQQLNAQFFLIDLPPDHSKQDRFTENDLAFYSLDEIEDLPKPILIANYLNDLNN